MQDHVRSYSGSYNSISRYVRTYNCCTDNARANNTISRYVRAYNFCTDNARANNPAAIDPATNFQSNDRKSNNFATDDKNAKQCNTHHRRSIHKQPYVDCTGSRGGMGDVGAHDCSIRSNHNSARESRGIIHGNHTARLLSHGHR